MNVFLIYMSENGWKFIDEKASDIFFFYFGDRKMSVEERIYVEARCK